ncbi:TetR/AcrR family transcriptional regulator [Mesorhizobium sp. BR1-1-16]|uniref:TetR/AcrR family transcriptional regulator n=1 Tax=Mesorhizobium sp. BR1-1-16 TaxID=2876653 RepID=UPI001CCDABA8|nr:TetR/AcrR family transcriptional regulator [Mesorhizobium sp. BR1-1-16]MBZ9935382.1 TetR/AcrR family transcriptional regulator [Mesorhizobium sp. BR1-1-16]
MALDAARAIAAAEGLRGLTVRRVAERIGYAPGTLYNLFDNLDALIVTLNGETLGRLSAALAAAATTGDVAARPSALVNAYFDFVEAEPQLWAVLFEHRLPEGISLPDWYRDGLAALVDGAVAALEPVMSAWPEASRRETVVAMWAGLHGISTLAVSGKLGLVATGPPRQLGHLIVERIIAAGPTAGGSFIMS